MRIYKYNLRLGEVNHLMLPAGSQILSVGVQQGIIRAWILLDHVAPTTEGCTFSIVGTGWDVIRDELGVFIGTVHDHGFVWHVFARHAAAITVSAEDNASAGIASVTDAIAELAKMAAR